MDRELEGIFPSGCFLFQLWGCPASALAVAGKGGCVLRAHPFFGTVAWCLFKTLLFPSYATRCRYDVPGVLASGSGLAALESPSVLVLAFNSSLVLVGGSSDGSTPGDRFLSPGRMCLIHSVPVEFSRFCAVSIGELAFLPPLDLSVLLSDPVAPSLEETFEVPMRVGSSSSLHGLSSD